MNVYIITLTWNCGDEFARCARTVTGNTITPALWAITDNGSLPAERELVEQGIADAGGRVRVVRYLRNPENVGLPAAYNEAMDWIAKNEPRPFHLILLSADTAIARLGWIRKFLDYAEANPSAGIIGGAKSPLGVCRPVYHHRNGRWYVHDKQTLAEFNQGETVDFAGVFIRAEVMARGIRFDPGYEFYDGHDQDLCFRVRSWGYTVDQIDAGILHYGSAAMKKAGYRWHGGGRHEWDALRAGNVERFAETWAEFLANHRPTVEAERAHVERMNAKLIAEAGDRKKVPGRRGQS